MRFLVRFFGFLFAAGTVVFLVGVAATALICGALPFTEMGQAVNSAALEFADVAALPLAAGLAALALAAVIGQTLAE